MLGTWALKMVHGWDLLVCAPGSMPVGVTVPSSSSREAGNLEIRI